MGLSYQKEFKNSAYFIKNIKILYTDGIKNIYIYPLPLYQFMFSSRNPGTPFPKFIFQLWETPRPRNLPF